MIASSAWRRQHPKMQGATTFTLSLCRGKSRAKKIWLWKCFICHMASEYILFNHPKCWIRYASLCRKRTLFQQLHHSSLCLGGGASCRSYFKIGSAMRRHCEIPGETNEARCGAQSWEIGFTTDNKQKNQVRKSEDLNEAFQPQVCKRHY